MYLQDPIKAPCALPRQAMFDDATRDVLRETLVAGDSAAAGDMVGVAFEVLAIFQNRRRTIRYTIENDPLFIAHRGSGAYDALDWRELAAPDQARMARLSMTVTTGPCPLAQAGVDDKVMAIANQSSSMIGLEILITAHALVLTNPGWQGLLPAHGVSEHFPSETCFTVMPHAPAVSAHDRRRMARDLAADLPVIEWSTKCDGARTDGRNSVAPSLVLPDAIG